MYPEQESGQTVPENHPHQLWYVAPDTVKIHEAVDVGNLILSKMDVIKVEGEYKWSMADCVVQLPAKPQRHRCPCALPDVLCTTGIFLMRGDKVYNIGSLQAAIDPPVLRHNLIRYVA